MRRNNRHLIRLYFILVIGMGLFGWQYAEQNWQVDFSNFSTPSASEENGWIDLFATLGEAAIQLFFGVTSGG